MRLVVNWNQVGGDLQRAGDRGQRQIAKRLKGFPAVRRTWGHDPNDRVVYGFQSVVRSRNDALRLRRLYRSHDERASARRAGSSAGGTRTVEPHAVRRGGWDVRWLPRLAAKKTGIHRLTVSANSLSSRSAGASGARGGTALASSLVPRYGWWMVVSRKLKRQQHPQRGDVDLGAERAVVEIAAGQEACAHVPRGTEGVLISGVHPAI